MWLVMEANFMTEGGGEKALMGRTSGFLGGQRAMTKFAILSVYTGAQWSFFFFFLHGHKLPRREDPWQRHSQKFLLLVERKALRKLSVCAESQMSLV